MIPQNHTRKISPEVGCRHSLQTLALDDLLSEQTSPRLLSPFLQFASVGRLGLALGLELGQTQVQKGVKEGALEGKLATLLCHLIAFGS